MSPQPKGHSLVAFVHWNCSCSCDESHTIRSPQSLQGISLLLQDFSCCGIFSLASRNAHPSFEHFTSSLGQCFWCACALAYLPFQSHPWLWHSTASSLVMWSRAILTAILDAWNSLRHIGHFGFAVDLVSCRRQTKHPEWPQLKLTGFNMALKLCGMGKKLIIIPCAWNTQLISTQRATYQILHCNRWSMESVNLQLNSVMFS